MRFRGVPGETPKSGQPPYNNIRIQQLAAKLIAPAFKPMDLLGYINNFVFVEEAANDLEALYTAINSRYPLVKAEYEKLSATERDSSPLTTEIEMVQQNAMFFIGLALGQRINIGPVFDSTSSTTIGQS